MDDHDKQELTNPGRAFREARERSGLNEREVAEAVRGISLAGVRAIEAGERPQPQLRADDLLGSRARRRTDRDHAPGRKLGGEVIVVAAATPPAAHRAVLAVPEAGPQPKRTPRAQDGP